MRASSRTGRSLMQQFTSLLQPLTSFRGQALGAQHRLQKGRSATQDESGPGPAPQQDEAGSVDEPDLAQFQNEPP